MNNKKVYHISSAKIKNEPISNNTKWTITTLICTCKQK